LSRERLSGSIFPPALGFPRILKSGLPEEGANRPFPILPGGAAEKVWIWKGLIKNGEIAP